MQLPITTKIAGKKTIANWNSIRSKLDDFNNSTVWLSAYNDFFLTRLNERYLLPIESIKTTGSSTGEGFAIMTIICSLIEFLETAYIGKNYRFIRKKDPPLGQYEYSKSEEIFIDFLTKRTPFNSHFDPQTSKDFYTNVRCSLLHEARTSSNWTISSNSPKNDLIHKTSSEIIINRNNFHQALITFIDSYKTELLSSDERKKSFLRKYDKLCEL